MCLLQTLLPLLAAAAMAAPGVLLASNPGAITLTAPALQYQVPLTQTVHYENRPVVTGYQTTVVKPAIASAPVIAPLAVSGITSNIAIRQLPEFTPPPTNSTTPPPIGDAPTLPPLTPPTQAPPSENGTSGDQGGQQPPIPIPGIPGGFANLFQIVNPTQLQFSSVAIPQQSVVVQQAAPVAAPVAAPAPVADAVVVEARAAPVPVQTVSVSNNLINVTYWAL